jgi:hypothetical protein
MADIINLRMVRKAKARAEAAARAEENRAKFGQTKADKKQRKAEKALEIRRIEAGKLEKSADDPE